MSWNYRVLQHLDEPEPYSAIHEVYYDEDGAANRWSKEPVKVVGDDIAAVLERMQRALQLPLLVVAGGSIILEQEPPIVSVTERGNKVRVKLEETSQANGYSGIVEMTCPPRCGDSITFDPDLPAMEVRSVIWIIEPVEYDAVVRFR